jgi:hypothetical protein
MSTSPLILVNFSNGPLGPTGSVPVTFVQDDAGNVCGYVPAGGGLGSTGLDCMDGNIPMLFWPAVITAMDCNNSAFSMNLDCGSL